ncbi:IS3 family transposase [Laribacter hongkongensis]|uniref:IS3 family transposase n=1 Tax=Laribacter hongkongensis TaxID=168471 RepID=UPI001EFCD9FD|nr:IS3 family transposase [Laribacter hongkongensis]MCG9065639.1 IS3 family transposase [Laribacter hongkongensis]
MPQPSFNCGRPPIFTRRTAANLRDRATCIRYGASRIYILLRREGWLINHKKTHRIYCEAGLNLRRKRRMAVAHRQTRPAVSNLSVSWSMAFVADQLFNDQKTRA